MKPTYFLVTTLIESDDCVSDSHQLYSSLEAAQKAMEHELLEAQENFSDHGERIIDLPSCVEWRNEDGYGYTVGIEELTYLD